MRGQLKPVPDAAREERRRRPRQASTPQSARLEWDPGRPTQCETVGIVLDRTGDGFGMVTTMPDSGYCAGRTVLLHCEGSPPLEAVVRWVRSLDESCARLGCELVGGGEV